MCTDVLPDSGSVDESFVTDISENVLESLSEYSDLPCTEPCLLNDIATSSVSDPKYEEWCERFRDEWNSISVPKPVCVPLQVGLGGPKYAPPWSRDAPVVQRAFRRDGARVRDGAGVSSPLIVDPFAHDRMKHPWPDVLEKFRTVLQWAVSNSNVKKCVSVVEQRCTALNRAVEAGSIVVSDMAVSLESSQMSLKSAVETASSMAVEKLSSVLPAVFAPRKVKCDLSIAQGQPFRLRLLSALAYVCGDPDSSFAMECESGLPLGDASPLSDCCHYPVKSDTCDPSAELITWSKNYVSAENAPEIVRELLQDDLSSENQFAHGPLTWIQLLTFLGLPLDIPEPEPNSRVPQLRSGIAVMRLGCINESQYDENGSCVLRKYRLVCDGTASGVNPRVLLPCVCETPGVLDGEALFSVPCGDLHLVGMKVDVKGAFKRLKLLPSEYGRAVFYFDGSWYVYVVLPFGMRASAYHWCRFYGLIHRVLKRLLQCFFHGSAMYIDDSLYCARVSQYADVFALILVFLGVLNVPLSWRKLYVGTLLDWVGFRIDFHAQRVFLSSVRLLKLRVQMEQLVTMPRVPVSEFRKLVFRMVWVCQIFPMAKVFLHGFFATLKSQVAATGFIFRVKHLEHVFDLWYELIEAAVVWDAAGLAGRGLNPHAVTRTDAMASNAGIFVAGWSAASLSDLAAGNLQWFAFHVDVSFFPEERASPNRLISAAEALGVALAIAAFGKVLVESDSMVTVLSSERWYSPSANLAWAMRMMVKAAVHWRFRPIVNHVSGKENALADALSRQHVDTSAAHFVSTLPAALRVPTEVFTNVLPELAGFLTPT